MTEVQGTLMGFERRLYIERACFHQVKIGKADGIVVELQSGTPPKIVYIETGWVTKARRIRPALASCLRRRSQPYRIPWKLVRDVGIDIDLDLDARDTPLLNVETWLRKLLRRMPFA